MRDVVCGCALVATQMFSAALMYDTSVARAQQPPALDATALSRVSAPPLLLPAAATIATHRLALSNTKDCPKVSPGGGTWYGTKLFAEPRNNGTRSYCSYDWVGSVVPVEPPSQPNLTIVPDGPVVIPLGLGTPGVPSDYAFTLTHLQLPKLMPSGQAPVQVSVLDSGRGTTAALDPNTAYHARAVSRLIEVVGCGEPRAADCKVQVTNLQALDKATNPNNNNMIIAGNAYGTRGKLAEQIEKSVPAASSGQRNIINLSVGWSGCWEPSLSAMSVEGQAVRDAIITAMCRGAIVVAASGNRDAVPSCPASSPRVLKTGNPSAVGEHMLPGVFADKQGGDLLASDCSGVDKAVAPDRRGIFLALGAVNDARLPLAITDRDTDLTAFGAQVSVPDGTRYTARLTGTSMSAAAVSGMLSALWAYSSTSSPKTVGKLLVDYGQAGVVSRPDRPKVCNDLGCVRKQLKLCNALRLLGSAQAKACSGRTLDAPRRPVASRAVDLEAQPACDTPGRTCDHSGADAAEEPWTSPQPGGDGCADCRLIRSSPPQVFVHLDAKLDGKVRAVRVTADSGTRISQTLWTRSSATPNFPDSRTWRLDPVFRGVTSGYLEYQLVHASSWVTTEIHVGTPSGF